MHKRSLFLDGFPPQNPSLILLRDRGYELGVCPAEEGSKEIGYWYAKRDDLEFRAADPLRLLGLVTLWEVRGATNWLDGDEDLFSKIAEDFLDY